MLRDERAERVLRELRRLAREERKAKRERRLLKRENGRLKGVVSALASRREMLGDVVEWQRSALVTERATTMRLRRALAVVSEKRAEKATKPRRRRPLEPPESPSRRRVVIERLRKRLYKSRRVEARTRARSRDRIRRLRHDVRITWKKCLRAWREQRALGSELVRAEKAREEIEQRLATAEASRDHWHRRVGMYYRATEDLRRELESARDEIEALTTTVESQNRLIADYKRSSDALEAVLRKHAAGSMKPRSGPRS